MFNVIYWTVLSIIVISLSHHLYSSMFGNSPERREPRQDQSEQEMREELTAYVNSLKK